MVNTKYLNLVSYESWSAMFPINLVFHWRLMFDTKLKLRYLLSDLKLLTLKNPGWSVSTNTNTTNWFWFLVWSGRWWRRSSTNWSFFSKWFWNLLRIFVLKRFQLDQLIKTPFGLGPDFVSGLVSSIEPCISICIHSTWT